MSARAWDIMRELPAIWDPVAGITSASVEIGYRDPASIHEAELPRVLVYNPTTADPELGDFGLRVEEYGFAVLVVGRLGEDEATLELSQRMAAAVNAAAFVAADRAWMSPGSIVVDSDRNRSKAVAILFASWEGV